MFKVLVKYVFLMVLLFVVVNINNVLNDCLCYVVVVVFGVVIEGCVEGVRAYASIIVSSVVGCLSDLNGFV